MSFFRHDGNLSVRCGLGCAPRLAAPRLRLVEPLRPNRCALPAKAGLGARSHARSHSSSAMSSRAGYSLAGCSPAEPTSASPTVPSMRWGVRSGNQMSANGNLSLTPCLRHGVHSTEHDSPGGGHPRPSTRVGTTVMKRVSPGALSTIHQEGDTRGRAAELVQLR